VTAASASTIGAVPVKFTITLEGPAQGIASPVVEFHIFAGDKASVIASTATLLAKNIQTGSNGRYTITPQSGQPPRYEWVFDYTPIQLGGLRSIFPSISLATSNGASGDWTFVFTIEASVN
jgi:hypothetical protein